MTDNNKKKDVSSEAEMASELSSLYENLIGNKNKNYNQGMRANDFRPDIINLPTAVTPPVQTRMLGTQYYANTPSLFVAPGYSQLSDLATKRSNQAVATNSIWQKTKANFINNMPKIEDVDYNSVQQEFINSMDEYEAKLNQGDWADQANMVSSFVDTLINKKGGKQLMSLNTIKEDRRKLIEEKLKSYDPKSLTGGIDQSIVKYALSGKLNPFIRDNDGNVIGGGDISYPEIYDKRNLPKEVNDFLSGAKGSIKLGTKKNENGEEVQTFMDETGILGKYGILSTEAYTKEQIIPAILAYLDSTNGDSYLGFEGKVREFNSPLSADEYRTALGELANSASDNSAYKQLLSLTDDELVTKAREIGLGERIHANNLKRSIIDGAVGVNEYSKQSVSFVNDDILTAVETARLTEPYKRSSGGGSGKQYDEDGNEISEDVPYAFMVSDTGIYNAPDIFASSAIAQRATQINKEIDVANQIIDNVKKNNPTNYENNKDYKNALKTKERLDIESRNINSVQKTTFKELSDVSKAANKIGLSYVVNVIKASGINMDTKKLATTLQTAIFAAIDDDPKSNPNEILTKAGIPTKLFLDSNSIYKSTDSKGKAIFDKFKTQDDEFKTEIDVGDGVKMQRKTAKGKPYFSVNNYINSISNKYKELKGQKDKWGRPTYNPQIETNQMVFRLTGESAKFPEAMAYTNVLKDISIDVAENTDSYKMYNPYGGKSKTLQRELLEITGLEPNELSGALELKGVELSSQQSFRGDKGFVYVAKYGLKEVSEKDDPKAYDAIQDLKKRLNGTETLNLPVQLDKNSHKDEKVKSALLNMLKKGDTTYSSLDPVTRQQAFLTLSKLEGIDTSIDSAYLYNLDGSGKNPNKQERDMRITGTDIRVKAVNNPFSSTKEDKSFQVKIKQNGEYKYLTVDDGSGQPRYASEAELKSNKNLTIRDFDTTEDLKAFFTEVKYRQEGVIGNFTKGGSKTAKYGTDRPADKSRTFNINVTRNGKSFKTTSYIPLEQLEDITGKVKLSSSAGIPFVNKEIAANAISLANNYGLTVTGGLRTKEHQVSRSAKSSSHFNGNALDFRMDNNARKLYSDIKNNPNLAKRLGIQFAHGGNHVHITFSRPDNSVSKQKNYSNNSIMKAIAQGESGNKNIGYHYTDRKKYSTAFGKYGFTDFWINKMAKYYDTSPDKVKSNPSLIDKYANTQYLKEATIEINPYFNKLKKKVERYIPNFSKEDAIFMYHYDGIDRIKGIIKGTKSINQVPGNRNRLTIREYILNKRKFL